MSHTKNILLAVLVLAFYSNEMALANNKVAYTDEFYSYVPGESDSYHIYYPGDKVNFHGHIYENVKILNNSHFPNDSNILDTYWKEVKPINT